MASQQVDVEHLFSLTANLGDNSPSLFGDLGFWEVLPGGHRQHRMGRRLEAISTANHYGFEQKPLIQREVWWTVQDLNL